MVPDLKPGECKSLESSILSSSAKVKKVARSYLFSLIFTKNEFCDYYIEEFKLSTETSKFGNEVIFYTLNKLLTLWHPYIPFVTTKIYSTL